MSIQIDKKTIQQFWSFVAERQRVWHKRHVLKDEWPWTEDVVLQENSFTNIYRTLDPGTEWTRENIWNRTDEDPMDILWSGLLYRLIGRQRTFQYFWDQIEGTRLANTEIPFLRFKEYNRDDFEKKLRIVQSEIGAPFSIAYLVSGYGWVPGIDKVEKVSNLFGKWALLWPKIYALIEEAIATKEPSTVYYALKDMDGIGEFLAYQTFVDMSYPRSHFEGTNLRPLIGNSSFVGFTQDTELRWAAAGPGAAAGISNLTGNRLSEKEARKVDLEVISYLWSKQETELNARDFNWLKQGYTTKFEGEGEEIHLSFSDIQNCLCEFSKWLKITNQTGRGRRKFIPPHMRNLADMGHRPSLNSNRTATIEDLASTIEEVDIEETSDLNFPVKRGRGRPRKVPVTF